MPGGSNPTGSVNQTELVYGHRRDGISFVRDRRSLVSPDGKFNLPVDKSKNMTVNGRGNRSGRLKLYTHNTFHRTMAVPDSLLIDSSASIYLSEEANDCLGLMEAHDK